MGRGVGRPSPPPIPQLRTERMHCTRRRSQLLLGMDVLILLASGASGNCHLVVFANFVRAFVLTAVWELESCSASSVCGVNVKCVGVEWILGTNFTMLHLFVTFYQLIS